MINMLRKGIKFSIQRVYFPQSYFESRHYGKRFNSIGKFKSLSFQLRAIYFHTFAVDMSVHATFRTCYFTLMLSNAHGTCLLYFQTQTIITFLSLINTFNKLNVSTRSFWCAF